MPSVGLAVYDSGTDRATQQRSANRDASAQPAHAGDHRLDGQRAAATDDTAVRVALWRTMHVEVDAPPHVLKDEIGLRLAAPDDDCRRRPDMDPAGTRVLCLGRHDRAPCRCACSI